MTFAPGRRKGGGGIDKMTRMNMASPIFESENLVSCRAVREEVIEEVASFPNGDHDDFCDSMTMALMRFRQGGFISLQGEELEDMLPAENASIIDGKTRYRYPEDPEAFLGFGDPMIPLALRPFLTALPT